MTGIERHRSYFEGITWHKKSIFQEILHGEGTTDGLFKGQDCPV